MGLIPSRLSKGERDCQERVPVSRVLPTSLGEASWADPAMRSAVKAGWNVLLPFCVAYKIFVWRRIGHEELVGY
jgi:hypothetical protein